MTAEQVLAAWDRADPETRGRMHYMLAERDEGKLLPRECPYAEGTPECQAFNQGSHVAMLGVMDGEE